MFSMDEHPTMPFCHLCLREMTGSPFSLQEHMEATNKGALATHWANLEEKTLASKTNRSDKTKYWSNVLYIRTHTLLRNLFIGATTLEICTSSSRKVEDVHFL